MTVSLGPLGGAVARSGAWVFERVPRGQAKAGNRPGSGYTWFSGSTGEADCILVTNMLQALPPLQNGWQGAHLPSSPMWQNVRIPPAYPSQQRRLLTWRGRRSLWTEAPAARILGDKDRAPGVP